MISIAVTGGIGSGKSYVANLLKQRGIPFYNADDEAKRLMLEDEGIRRDLIALLGEEVYQDGGLNKPLLAAYLFSDPVHTARVNAIVHPRVKADFCRWLRTREDFEIAGFESAILFEAGFEDTVDVIVTVYAPESLRLERVIKRDCATVEQVQARMKAQMSDEEKCRKSHFVVRNDGTSSLDIQLSALIEQIKSIK